MKIKMSPFQGYLFSLLLPLSSILVLATVSFTSWFINFGFFFSCFLFLFLVFGFQTQPWMSRAYDPCTERYSDLYFNRPEVQKALHANVTGIPYAWKACRYYLYAIFFMFSWVWGLFYYFIISLIQNMFHNSDIVGNYWTDSPLSMLPIYQELISAGLRIWVYRYLHFLLIFSYYYYCVSWIVSVIWLF